MRRTWERLALLAGFMGVVAVASPRIAETRGFGTPTVDGTLDAVYGAAEATDGTGAPQGNAVMDLGKLYVCNDATYWYFYFTVNANIGTTNWGKYLLYIDTNGVAASGATTDAWGRNVRVLDPHKPEFSINGWVDSPPYGANHTQLWAWNGTAWSSTTSADAAALSAGAISGIEWKVARTKLGDPTQIWCEVYATGGGATDNAQDTANNPAEDWNATDWTSQSILANSTNVPRSNGADATPPTVLSAAAIGFAPMDSVQVVFSEPVDKTTAETSTNYTLTNSVSVISATRSATDSAIVTLRTSTLPVGTNLKVTAINVKDKANNTIVANGTTNVACFSLTHVVMRAHMNLHLRTHSVPPNTVGWEGSLSPLTWDPTCDYPLSDVDGDSVYTGEAYFNIPDVCATASGTVQIEYKLTHTCTEWESSSNHVLTINQNTANDTLDIWWNDLAPANYTTKAVDVKFTIDAAALNPTVSDLLTVNGDQNPLNWNVPSSTAMVDNGTNGDAIAGDKIYTARVRFPAASFKDVQFKFLFNGTYECTDGQPNRSFTINDTGNDTTNVQVLPLAYFNRCDHTGHPIAVTFRVNTQYMSQAHTASDSLFVNGALAPLTWDQPPLPASRLLDNGVGADLVAGDGIYSGTIVFPDSSYKYGDYKFWFKGAYECLGVQPNRTLTLNDSSSVLVPQIVNANWNICQNTGIDVTPGAPRAGIALASVAPSPSKGAVSLAVTLGEAGFVRVLVTDASGRLVRELVNGPRPAGPLTARWDGRDGEGRIAPRGVYFVRAEMRGSSDARRIVLVP